MTPNDLDAYLQVFERRRVGVFALKLADGTEVHATFIPDMPVNPGADPTPGGWKSPQHLDNPDELRGDYKGELPS
jgi:hypothetical protein